MRSLLLRQELGRTFHSFSALQSLQGFQGRRDRKALRERAHTE